MTILDRLPARIADLARGLAGSDYSSIRAGYLEVISNAMMDYFLGDAAITSFRNSYKRAVLEFFDIAFFSGYIDGGGQIGQMSDEDREWFLAKQAGELGYVDMLFQQLKALRRDVEQTPQGLVGVAMQHAEGYTKQLDGVYAEGVLRGGREVVYEFLGDDGYESCPECQAMKNQQHAAEWIISRDAVPYPGTSYFSCHGYRCQHFWQNAKTGEILGRAG